MDFFDEKYELLECIGQGATSRVYHVKDENKISYAAKIIKDNVYRDCIENEMNKMSIILNPHTPALCDVVADHLDNPVLIMEKFDGSDLRDQLGVPYFNERQTRWYAAQISSVLLHIHALGIVHGDINPRNILVGNNNDQVKVIDYSCAHYPALEIPKGHCRGTKQFRSPEQESGKRTSPGSDFYSFGKLLTCIANGTRRPWSDETPFSDQFNEGIQLLIQEDPNKRIDGLNHVMPKKIDRSKYIVC